jgi:hypothetical protein
LVDGVLRSRLIHTHREGPLNRFILGKLKCEIHPSSIRLEHDEKLPLDISEIEISVFPCYYGGYRYYGLCPACNRCIRSLYVLDGTIPVCRICLRMVYSSQNATFSYRLYRKLKSVKSKLDNDECTKPKWMRKKTFEELRAKVSELDEKREIAHFFSLRNHRSVNKIFDKYGSVIGAAEILGS